MSAKQAAHWSVVLVGLAGVGRAQDLPAQPRDYIVDLAGVVDRATLQRLNGYLQELEQKTSTQIIVLTVHTTDGVPIRDYALRVAEKWKLGRKGKDNGALVVIAVKDRQWTFEVGYGLEPVLPDAFCGRVGREVFVPHFKKGRYGEGLAQGTLVLANRVASAASVQIAGMPARELRAGRRATSGIGYVGLLVVVFLVVFFLRGLAGRRRYGYSGSIWPWLVLDAVLRSGSGRHTWSGGGGWSGGFGSGGFDSGGSFGGGGGGSFGGGGASGGW